MVREILACRPTLYTEAGLEDWSSNRGSNINKKIQLLLKKFGAGIPGAADVVAEEVAALTKNKKVTPTKPKTATPKTSASKKRKVVKSEEGSEEEEY